MTLYGLPTYEKPQIGYNAGGTCRKPVQRRRIATTLYGFTFWTRSSLETAPPRDGTTQVLGHCNSAYSAGSCLGQSPAVIWRSKISRNRHAAALSRASSGHTRHDGLVAAFRHLNLVVTARTYQTLVLWRLRPVAAEHPAWPTGHHARVGPGENQVGVLAGS